MVLIRLERCLNDLCLVEKCFVICNILYCLFYYVNVDGIYGIGDFIVLNIFIILIERFLCFLKVINNFWIKMMLF